MVTTSGNGYHSRVLYFHYTAFSGWVPNATSNPIRVAEASPAMCARSCRRPGNILLQLAWNAGTRFRAKGLGEGVGVQAKGYRLSRVPNMKP